MSPKHFFSALVLAAFTFAPGFAFAKLPAPAPLTDEQKLKADETKAKAAEAAKKESVDLGVYQDYAAKRYFAASKAAGKQVAPSSWVPPAPPAGAAPAAAPTKAAAAAAPKK